MKFEILGNDMIQTVLAQATTYETRVKDSNGKIIATDTITPVEQKFY
jgi:hypothetical protein